MPSADRRLECHACPEYAVGAADDGPACLSYLAIHRRDRHPLRRPISEFGVMDRHMCEVEVCRVLVERAERVIVAADASKFTAKG